MTPLIKQKVDTRVVVETPEGADFQFVIAGAGTRAIAWLIDRLIQAGILALVSIMAVFLLPFGEAGAGLGFGGILIISFLLDWFYFSLFEAYWNGQTPGKRSQGLRVIRTNGTPIDPASALYTADAKMVCARCYAANDILETDKRAAHNIRNAAIGCACLLYTSDAADE